VEGHQVATPLCRLLALSGQSDWTRVCPLLDNSRQRWILARNGLSANDPTATNVSPKWTLQLLAVPRFDETTKSPGAPSSAMLTFATPPLPCSCLCKYRFGRSIRSQHRPLPPLILLEQRFSFPTLCFVPRLQILNCISERELAEGRFVKCHPK
jgi:hypothetical protein